MTMKAPKIIQSLAASLDKRSVTVRAAVLLGVCAGALGYASSGAKSAAEAAQAQADVQVKKINREARNVDREIDQIRSQPGFLQAQQSAQRAAQLRDELAMLDTKLNASAATGVEAVQAAVRQALGTSGGVELLKLTGGVTEASDAGLSRIGVTLEVAGSYHDLTRYVQALERDIPGVRWAGIELSAKAAAKPVLVATLYVLEQAK